MKTFAAIALLVAGLSRATAEPVSTEAGSVRSHTGQFVAYAAPALPAPARFSAPDRNIINLEPALLVISCERIKHVLWRELDANTPWQGKVSLNLYHARSADDPITIVAEKGRSGWLYRVQLPDSLDQTRFLRAIVQVLLLELANRGSDGRSAEIPVWLAEGFSQELLVSDGMELILPPPRGTENGLNITYMMVNSRRTNTLTQAQHVLRSRPPLSYEQLSWPADDDLSGDIGDVYRSSAQLFVNQLLHLKDGPACFRAMLDDLPHRYNWQFSFISGFRPYFQSSLDVEKWWALQLVQFSGRDLMQTWLPAESWNKLDDIVRTRVEVRSSSKELPMHTEVSMQTIIREWDTVRQTQELKRKLQDLTLLRVHVAQELIVLVDDYRGVIGTYLQKRNSGSAFFPFIKHAPSKLGEETIVQLNALDSRRESLRPLPAAPVTTAGVGEGPGIAP